MKNSGPGSQPVRSPHAIPEQARLQSSPVASDPICQHPGCQAMPKNGRARYCDEHGSKAYVAMRHRVRMEQTRSGLRVVGQKACAVCGKNFRLKGGNQRYCEEHRDRSRDRQREYRPGASYAPKGMPYADWVAEIASHGLSMHQYTRRRRRGQTHGEAIGEQIFPDRTLYPPTDIQRLASRWLGARL